VPGGDACDRTWLRVAVKPSLLACLHALDCAVGLPPCLLAFGVLIGGWGLTEGPVGVVDPEALAVVLHEPGAVPPGAPPTDGLGDRAKRRGEVDGLFQFGEGDPLARPQRQLPGHLPVVTADLLVVLPPCLVPLLRRPGLDLGLGGPRRRVFPLGTTAAAEQTPPAPVAMLGLGGGELLLSLPAPLSSPLQQAGAVGWRLVQLGLEPVPLGAKLAGGRGPHVHLAVVSIANRWLP
jgi:hypothetical protein